MIAVDSSALVAIALTEPGFETYLAALDDARDARIAPINYVETGIVLTQRGFLATRARFDLWLHDLAVVPDEAAELGSSALAAYLRFGKGHHPAQLNLGDCFAYALARQLDAPLLYKGQDFALTDIRPARQPT